MDTREAITNRIRQLCKAQKITPNRLSTISVVPQATIKNTLNGESQNPGLLPSKSFVMVLKLHRGNSFPRRNLMGWSKKLNKA